jgi:predicted ATP-grasp superfamily ATP-dependent carboligase
MRRAVAAEFAALDDLRVWMTLDSGLPAEPGPWHTVRIEPGAEKRTVQELAARADWTLVIAPETGMILQERASWVLDAGGRSLGSTPEAIARTADKLALAAHLHSVEIAHPETSLLDGPGSWPFENASSVVLKPRDGAGCLDTLRRSALEGLPRDYPWPALAQPYVAGEAQSASFLVDCLGRAWPIAVARQRIVERDGSLHYEGGEIPAASRSVPAEARRAVESVAGLRGWVGVDLVAGTDSRAVVIEINPRLTTSFVGLVRLLPAGSLARAWIACLEHGEGGEIQELAHRVACSQQVGFEADGSFIAKEARDHE